tara:strand:- start:545 stop:724 length:180 start_codon:yes stop_codon:yes gene_type:complete
MSKIGAILVAMAAAISFSTKAMAMGDCGGSHTFASAQQLVDASGSQTPQTPKPTTCSGG